MIIYTCTTLHGQQYIYIGSCKCISKHMHTCHANVCVNLNICLAKNVNVHDLHLHTQQQCKAFVKHMRRIVT
jgi:hypothetical protein